MASVASSVFSLYAQEGEWLTRRVISDELNPAEPTPCASNKEETMPTPCITIVKTRPGLRRCSGSAAMRKGGANQAGQPSRLSRMAKKRSASVDSECSTQTLTARPKLRAGGTPALLGTASFRL